MVGTDRFDAVIFDTDGVVTDTAIVHAAAWKRLFDEYLARRGDREGRSYEPFDAVGEYLALVDGKPRYDGVRSFLAARAIELADGAPTDPPGRETVCGLGNAKDAYFHERLSVDGRGGFPRAGRLLGPEGQGRPLAGAGPQQVKRDLPADQVAHLGVDAADADPAYRKLTQQGEQAEFVALELPVGFDDEQPVAIILPRQQLGARGGRLHLSGLYLGGQQHGEQPAAA